MEYKKFSKSDFEISRLGFGAWGIGKTLWVGAEDAESKKALHKAIETGVNFFDSALVYGNGHSERLIGEVEKESGKELFITSKVPSKRLEWPAKDSSSLKDSFPVEHIINSTEKSLRNLKRDHLDLQQFHVWSDTWAEQDEWKEAVTRLKKDGKVRYFGISINDHQPSNGIEAGKTGLIDSFQVIFNIFDQSPLDDLFPFCKENNISIIARVPFDEGALTGKVTPDTEFPRKDFRNSYFRGDRKQEVWDRLQKINELTSAEAATPAEAALRFTISFDEMTTVIPGMRSTEHLMANVAAVEKGALSVHLIKNLAENRWIRNFYA
jgi:aryl-alcohol dehydrogenase-like predicted oxidoreductase